MVPEIVPVGATGLYGGVFGFTLMAIVVAFDQTDETPFQSVANAFYLVSSYRIPGMRCRLHSF